MMDNMYKQLIEKYGEKQVIVAIEEMADVYIMLEQMEVYFNIKGNEISEMILYKKERTRKRLLE